MLSATATSIVQLIGIITMTTSLSNDGHFQAVAPKIPAVKLSTLHPEDVTARANGAIHYASDDVEPHTVLIVFRACDYVSSQGWPPMALEKEPGFLYVQLDGERIEIVPEGKESMPTVQQKALRTPVVRPRLNIRYVQHLQDSCPTMTDVNGAFKEPDFNGAATVVDLPIVGTVDACRGNPNSTVTSRIDTRVKIPNNGHIVIHAKRPTEKRIVLAGNTKIYVAHIPTSYITGKTPQGTFSLSHFHAYYSMTMNHDCRPTGDVTLPDPNVPEACDASPLAMRGSGLSSVAFLDVQCSTSQWP